MPARVANRLGYIECPACGFADANVYLSAKTNCAYHQCPKCKDFSRGTEPRDKMLRAKMHTEPKGEALPKRDRGRPPKEKPKAKPKPKQKTKPAVVDDDDDDDDEQADFWKFW